MSQTFSAARRSAARTKALVCMVEQTSESNTAAQRLAASHAPQATTRLRPGPDTGGSTTNRIKQRQRIWMQMASAWEDSWGLSGSFSHLKHGICGAEPISSEAAAPAAGWGGQRHGAGMDWTRNKREQPGCLAGAGGEGARQVTAGQPAASAPAAWLWSAGTCPSLPQSDASRPLSPSAAAGRAGASPPCSGTHK